jgi:FkbM family methyltransferase
VRPAKPAKKEVGMFSNPAMRVTERIIRKLRRNPDPFLRHISGLVHVGANTGQERKLYGRLGLRVLWIEPIPRVYDRLLTNIEPFPDQRAIQCLIGDKDDVECEFHIANNDGASSSILELKEHRDVWPGVRYSETITLKTITLTSLFERQRIDPSHYQALIIDTQGSELLVLHGSVLLLGGFTYIKTEVPDFESYKGCCQLPDMEEFMSKHGYTEVSRDGFASRPQGGSYFDVIYRRRG